MYYTYIIKSQSNPTKTYIGITSNLKTRLTEHNSGNSPHTSQHIPWAIEFYCAFQDQQKAIQFEKYLKSHSGRSFTKKHF